jgi:L-iditol 2-dehydrogenase
VINARYRGARVIGVDSNRYRAQLALELGADIVLDPADAPDEIKRLTDGVGVDRAVDCSGVVAAHRLCIDATRRHGAVAFVGESSEPTPVTISPDMIRKGLTLVGSWHYNLKDTPRIMRMIAAVGDSLDKLITHRFALNDVQQAWELQASGQCGKVLLHPWA